MNILDTERRPPPAQFLASAIPSPGASGPGRAYAWEAIGGLAGGALFSFVFAERVDGAMLGLLLPLFPLALAAATPRWVRTDAGQSRAIAIAAGTLLTMLTAAAVAGQEEERVALPVQPVGGCALLHYRVVGATRNQSVPSDARRLSTVSRNQGPST